MAQADPDLPGPIQPLKTQNAGLILMAMFWLLAKILNVRRIETTPEGFHRCRCRVRIQNAVPGTVGKTPLKGQEGWIERVFWRIPRRGEQILLTSRESRVLQQPAWFEHRVFDAHHPVSLHNPQGLTWAVWEGSRCLAQGKELASTFPIKPRKSQPRDLILTVEGKTVDQAILAPNGGNHRYFGPGLIYGRQGIYLENGHLRLGLDPKGGRLVYLQDLNSGDMIWSPRAAYHFSIKALVSMGLGLSLEENKPWIEDMEVRLPRSRLGIDFRKKKKNLLVEIRYCLVPKFPIFKVNIHIATKRTSWTVPLLQWSFPFPKDRKFKVFYQSYERLETLWAPPPERFAFPQEIHDRSFPYLGIDPGPRAIWFHFPFETHGRLLGSAEGPILEFRFPPIKGKKKGWVSGRWSLTIAIGSKLLIGEYGGMLEIPGGYLIADRKFNLNISSQRYIPGTYLIFSPSFWEETGRTESPEV